jgi:hypothetical protein
MERAAEETWTVPEVYLLTEGPDGVVAVPALTLSFYADRIEVDKADGDEVWSQLEEMSPTERSVLLLSAARVVHL